MQVVTLLLFAGYIAVSVWGVTRMTTGFDLFDSTPEDSYYRVFYSRYFTSFPSYREDVFVVFPNRQEWWKKDVRVSGWRTRINQWTAIVHSCAALCVSTGGVHGV